MFEGDKEERAKDNQQLTNFLEQRKALYETYMASVIEYGEKAYDDLGEAGQIYLDEIKSIWVQASKDPDILIEKMPRLIGLMDRLYNISKNATNSNVDYSETLSNLYHFLTNTEGLVEWEGLYET